MSGIYGPQAKMRTDVYNASQKRANAINAFNKQLAHDADIVASMRGYKAPGAYGLAHMSAEDADRQYLLDEQKYFGGPVAVPSVVADVSAKPAVVAKPVTVAQKRPTKSVDARPVVGSGQAAIDNEYYIPKQDAKDIEMMSAMREAYAAQQAAAPAAPVASTGLAAKATGNGLDESVAYWLNGDDNGQAPEGYIPTARYNSFLDMFK